MNTNNRDKAPHSIENRSSVWFKPLKMTNWNLKTLPDVCVLGDEVLGQSSFPHSRSLTLSCVSIMWPREKRERRGHTRHGSAGCATVPPGCAGSSWAGASVWFPAGQWRTGQSRCDQQNRCCSLRCARKLRRKRHKNNVTSRDNQSNTLFAIMAAWSFCTVNELKFPPLYPLFYTQIRVIIVN